MVWDRASKIRVTMTVTTEGEFHLSSALRFLKPPQADFVVISQVPAQTRGLLPKATIDPACLRATAPGVSVQEAALLLIEACDMSRFCISFRLAHVHSPLHNTGRSN
jgi:hypothetical protein